MVEFVHKTIIEAYEVFTHTAPMQANSILVELNDVIIKGYNCLSKKLEVERGKIQGYRSEKIKTENELAVARTILEKMQGEKRSLQRALTTAEKEEKAGIQQAINSLNKQISEVQRTIARLVNNVHIYEEVIKIEEEYIRMIQKATDFFRKASDDYKECSKYIEESNKELEKDFKEVIASVDHYFSLAMSLGISHNPGDYLKIDPDVLISAKKNAEKTASKLHGVCDKTTSGVENIYEHQDDVYDSIYDQLTASIENVGDLIDYLNACADTFKEMKGILDEYEEYGKKKPKKHRLQEIGFRTGSDVDNILILGILAWLILK